MLTEPRTIQAQLETLIKQARPLLYQFTHEGIFFKNLNFEFIDCNQYFVNFSELADKSLIIGKQDFDLPWGKDASFYRLVDEISLRDGKKDILLDFYVAGGRRKFAMQHTRPLYNDEGHLLGLVTCLRELPKAKRHLISVNTGHELNVAIKSPAFAIDYLFESYHNQGVTRREAECFLYILRGLSSKSIARLLDISPRTVEKFIFSLRAKLRCPHKNALIQRAYQDGLLSIILGDSYIMLDDEQ